MQLITESQNRQTNILNYFWARAIVRRMSTKQFKSFPLAQVLSITTGRLVCPMGGIYEILNFVTGDELYTHVLPRACRFAEPLILKQYPSLAEASCEKSMAALEGLIASEKQEGVERWLLYVRGEFRLNLEYEIECQSDSWLSMNPVKEAESMMGGTKDVIVVTP